TQKGQALRHRVPVGTSVVLSPDGKTLASVTPDRLVMLWTLDLAKKSIVPRGEVAGAYFAAFSPDGKVVASGRNSVITFADVATREEKAALREHPAAAVAFRPDGKVLASTSKDRTITLWDLASGRVVDTLAGPLAVSCLEFSRDGKFLTLGGRDGSVRLWDPTTGKSKFVYGARPVTVLAGGDGSVPLGGIVPTLVAFRSDGMRLAAVAGSLLVVWGAGGRFVSRVVLEKEACSVAFSPDGKLLVTGLVEGGVALHDADTGRERAVLEGPPGWVLFLAFSPDGKVLTTVSVSAKEGLSRVRLGDVASGKVRASPQDARGLFGTAAFSPDGRMLAYGAGDGTIKLWDVAEGKERAPLKGAAKGSCALAFSPDGKVVACAGLGGDPQTGE